MLRHSEAGWTNPKVLSILAVVFLCGAAFGAAMMRQYIHSHFSLPTVRDFIYQGHRVGFDTLKRTLNLTPQQEQTVEAALDDFAKYYQTLEEQREDVAEAGKRRIDAVLTPEQKRRFAQILKQPPEDR
jgi:hypothetical protein